jgi:glycerol-3-phosphate O-acyltransferase
MKKSTLNYQGIRKSLEIAFEKKAIPEKQYRILLGFFEQYQKAAHKTAPAEAIDQLFETLLYLMLEQIKNPYAFGSYHKRVRKPFDYYSFGMEFVRYIIDSKHSKVLGLEHVKEMAEAIKAGENVILFANHQTEVDPYVIDYLLQNSYPEFGSEIIFVAGDRVVTDPAAIPFSLGRNLLCIYSKKYIDHPPELKEKKQLHNSQTMKRMSELLSEGGKTIYVAPSGGRDRKNGDGIVEVAPFDPQSVEMFHLMTKRAKAPTHFYPLALVTYDLLPPPDTVQKELGETRIVNFAAAHMAFGPRIDMQSFSGEDKTTLRKNRADSIWQQVKTLYESLLD